MKSLDVFNKGKVEELEKRIYDLDVLNNDLTNDGGLGIRLSVGK
jgi:hypothetical protein